MERKTIFVTEIADFAHRLYYDYEGKCKNIHGHRFYFEVELPINDFPKEKGISIDFTNIKKIIRTLDHTIVLYEKDPLFKYLIENFEKLGIEKDRIIGLPGNPTAENIAMYLCERIKELSPSIHNVLITVYETPSNAFTLECQT
ncbi:MAG: 6-pyruvoyl trahydropterin synthase family protein [Candidatus Heimdallarchaeaceae archaeon]